MAEVDLVDPETDHVVTGPQMVPVDQITEPVILSHVTFKGDDEPTPIVLDERDGNTVYIRKATDDDGPNPEPVHFDPTVDQLVPVTRVTHAALHTTGEVGRLDDLFLKWRVVPVRRDGQTVEARTLKHGEEDAGEAVRLLPGDRLVFPAGSMSVELEAIDERMPEGEDGYRALAEVLWTWLSIGSPKDEWFAAAKRYVVTAARRLDTSHVALTRVRASRALLQEAVLGYEKMRVIHEMIGDVETMVIMLSRAVQMAQGLHNRCGISTDVPESLHTLGSALKNIRDAYEHIDERAYGTVRGKPDPEALTVFDYAALVDQHVVRYGRAELSIEDEMPVLILATRDFLKKAGSDLAEYSP